jgi:hypothetical protein
MNYIALCSPDNIGALLDTIASLRSKLEEAEGALDPRAPSSDLVGRLEKCATKLEGLETLPKPYDLYYAVKNDAPGWSYHCAHIGVSDIREAATALTAQAARIAELEGAPKIAVIRDNEGVCLSGRWAGWLFRKHPDGQWVSVLKLELRDPLEGNSVLAALASIRGGA